MRIIRCHVENFGKLSDFSIDFSDKEKNVIFRENGWGKSTLAAFIKVMFYGFDNEGKRDDYENERKRFKPWQGGVYGGQIVFEAGGREYEASRVFGTKDKEDEFVLKETATGLESNAYSQKLGEELFGLDSKSFIRTIFVSQDACETSVTDGISAKLGNLTDCTDDIINYDKASSKLADMINSISPRRKTGELAKQKDEMTRLKQVISQSKNVEKTLDNLLRLSREEKNSIDELKKEQIVWNNKQQELSVYKDKELKKHEYERLCKDYSDKQNEYEAVRLFFKKDVPDSDKLKEVLEEAYSISDKQSALKLCELSEEENIRLVELNNIIENGKEKIRKEKTELDKLNAQNEEDKNNKEINDNKEDKRQNLIKSLLCFVIGIVCLALAIVIKKVALFVCVVAFFAIVILIIRVINKKEDEEENSDTENESELAEKEERINEHLKLYEQNIYLRDNLVEKKEKYLKLRSEYNHIHDRVYDYLVKSGFEPKEDMYRQLDLIEEKVKEINILKTDYEKIKKEKELFEINNDISELDNNENISKNMSLTEIDENLRRIAGEIEAHNKNISGYSRQIDEFEEKLEYISECENELENLTERYEENKHKYRILEETKDMLEMAKAAFTAKYTAPIKNGFDKYYNMITGNPDNTYRLDANINLSHKELGLDRNIKFLSMGYKDLVGVCMRMALVDAMYEKEKPFVIFDDSFVNLDKDKLDAGIRFLDCLSKEYQVIYFTCHESRI